MLTKAKLKGGINVKSIFLAALLVSLLLLPASFADVNSVSADQPQKTAPTTASTNNVGPSLGTTIQNDPPKSNEDIPQKNDQPDVAPTETPGSSSGTSSGGGSSKSVTKCKGDMDGDRTIDVFDINKFSIAWNKWNTLTGREYVFLSLSSTGSSTIKDESFWLADVNGDGQINNEDIKDFVSLIVQKTVCKA